MKKPQAVFAGVVFTFGLVLVLHGQTAAGGGQTGQQLPAPTPYAVVNQDADSRVWERTTYSKAADGTIVARKSDYTEIQSGLNYKDPATGQWTPSKEEIDIQPGSDGAFAIQGQHRAYFPGDIFQGMIKEVTPDGLTLQSRPVGLFYADDTNSILIAILTNSVGELVSSNQIVYPNAFEGADASIRYTYRKAGFEQDVIVQGQLPDPGTLGLDPARTRLGMLTVFFDTNHPVVTPGATDAADGLSDSTLTFGKMKIGRGQAFAIGDTEPSTPPTGATPAQWLNWFTNAVQQAGETPTFKRWFRLDGRNYLMEEVPYHRVAAQLSQLPAATARQNVIGTKLYAANTFLEALPARLLSPAVQVSKSKMTRLARKEPPHGLVLDYQTVPTSGDYTFLAGSTYLVSGACYLDAVTLQGGTVIKYANMNSVSHTQIGNWSAAAFIAVDGPLTCNTTATSPAIFTAYDDNTVGQTLPYSTGNPAGPSYADPAIYAPGNTSVSLSNVRINYADAAVMAGDDGKIAMSDSQVLNSGVVAVLGMGDGNSAPMALTCNNCLLNGYGILVEDYGFYEGGDSYNLTNCTIKGFYYLTGVGNNNFYSQNYGHAVNSIFANIGMYSCNGYCTWSGGYNGFYGMSTTFGSPKTTATSNPFQTSGSDGFYLAADYPFRNIGTTAISSTLLADLQNGTTSAPQAGYYLDTGTPDLGYHYPLYENEDSDQDGLPDWWEWYYLGSSVLSGSNHDGQNYTLLSDYQNLRVPQIIVQQPMSQNAYIGDTVVLSVQTLNGLTPHYQWEFNGTPIPGATGSSYTIANVQSVNEGNYTVVITCGTYPFTSAQSLLTVSSVIDPNYREIIGSRMNYTFKSGFTYYIGSNVPLYGNTTIEGGAILKFDWSYLASLHILGTLTCKGGPYQPAILTSVNDDSVGEYVCSGGYSYPNLDESGYYYTPFPWPTGVPYLEMADAQSAAISNLCVRFADIGVSTPIASRSLDVWDCQFIDCGHGIVNFVPGTGAVDSLHNVLFSSPDYFTGSVAVKAGNNAINITAEQVTSDTDYFCQSLTTPHQITMVNSLIGGHTVTASSLSTVDVQFNPSVANFVSVGEGNYYLAPGSSFHNSGTTSISSRLQTELKGKTTSPPLAIAVNTTVTGDMTLSPQVQRYTGGQPDFGYYYDALDYTVADFYVSGGNLTVLPGTAIGIRNDRIQYADGTASWTLEGFICYAGGSIISHGMPNKPNIFVASDLVQEMPPNPFLVSSLDTEREYRRFVESYYLHCNLLNWYPASHLLFETDYEAADPAPPTLDFRFSNFYLLAGDMHIASGMANDNYSYFSDQSAVNLYLRDCQMHGGQINLGKWNYDINPGSTTCEVSWFNNLFDNVTINIDPDYRDLNDVDLLNTDLHFEAYNNLFRGGSWLRIVPIQATAGNWKFEDNLFDKVEFWQNTGFPLDYDYNAYWPRQSFELFNITDDASGATDASQFQPSTGGALSGAHESTLDFASAPPYASGPLGNYYLPDSTLLHGAGSRTAAAAGLYHYTTRVDQTKEGNDNSKVSPNINVNIGLHYIAADSNGQPKDTDGDGIFDYVENWNGDGDTGPNRIHTTDETDWNYPKTDGSTPDAYSTIYDDIDLSGNGLVGRIEKVLGKNPLDSSNPLVATQVITGEEPEITSFEVPISYDALTGVGTLHLLMDGGQSASYQECDRAADGNCLLAWNTSFDSPGQHYFQVQLNLNGNLRKGSTPDPTILTGVGKLNPSYSANICQFDPFYSEYDDSGAMLYARLTEPNASYTIELKTPAGDHIKTITGSTSSGEINENWNLTFDDGVTKYTGDSVDAVYNVTLPDLDLSGILTAHHYYNIFRLEGDFTIAYAWDDSYQAQHSMRDAIEYGVVDTLIQPPESGDNGSLNPYNSTFNAYTYSGDLSGNPGWLSSPDVVPTLINNLADSDTRNFYFDGHGNEGSIGNSAAPNDPGAININAADLQVALNNSRGKINHFYHPYRFVFLNACKTADDPTWSLTFGIPEKMTDAEVTKAPGRVRAFLGWVNEARAAETDDDWYDEEQTYSVFYGAWMLGWPLENCIRTASSAFPPEPFNYYVLNFPLGKPFPWFQYYWPYNFKPFRLKIYGYAGITRSGFEHGFDNSPYYK